MHMFLMKLAEMLIAKGNRLEPGLVEDLAKNYRSDEFTDQVRIYIERLSTGEPFRRGRPRRGIPIWEVRRRIEILLDYDVAFFEFSQEDKMPKSRPPRRAPHRARDTPQNRALKFIKDKYGWGVDLRTIANCLSLWRKDKTIRRIVRNELLDRAGIKRRRTPMLVVLREPPPRIPSMEIEA